MSEEAHNLGKEIEGLGWRVSLSIFVDVEWLLFLVLWLFFYAKDYAWENNVAILGLDWYRALGHPLFDLLALGLR
jgi:hypothetical protein